MATKLQLISELSEQTAQQITDHVDSWKGYLNTAARLYKYPFEDQLLIHAQKPDATACAQITLWNGKMNRWVKPGSKGIALIHKGSGNRRLEYVFDVSDTRPVKGAKTPWLWEMRKEHQSPILAALEEKYGETQGEDFGDRLMELAARSVGESYREHLHDLSYDLEDSFLEGLDDLNLDVRFRNILTASVQYTLLTRCGLDASEYLDDEDLRGITEFSTPAVLHHLGDAASTVSADLLQEIGRTIRSFERENLRKPLAKSNLIRYTENMQEFNTLKRERSNKNGIDIHEGWGLSGTGFDAGRGGGTSAAAGQIRDAQGDVLAGAPSRNVHLDAVDRQTVPTFEGNRPDSTDESGHDADRADETKRRGREAESIRPDEVGAGSEQPESASGGNRPERAGVQLNQTKTETAGEEPAVFASPEPEYRQIALFPTVEEQIENIAQAKAEEKQSSAFSFFPRIAVSQEVIDRILTSGGNSQNSVLRITANLQKDLTGSAHSSFLQKEYGTGGKGFKIDGREYALWFDAEGLRIAPGRTTNVPSCTRVPWVQVAIDIRRLLQNGQYLTLEKLKAVPDNERKEISEKLWYLRQDLSDEAREQGLLPHVSELYGGFPNSTKQIAELLSSDAGREPFLTELAEFTVACQADPELLRFPRIHNPKELWARLADLGQKPVAFPTDPDFKPERPTFITNDELDNMLTRGSSISESKMRIYSYYMQGHDLNERVKFLRNEYGTGGHCYTGYSENHDSKGISLTREDEISGYDGYDTVMLNWNRVEKRIGELIKSGRYMNQKDLDYIPAYEKQKLAQNVYHFYSGLPLDIERPFPLTEDYYNIENTILPLMDDHAEMEKIHAHMTETMAGIEPNNRHYAYNRRALDNVTAFINGTYSLFTPLSAEKLQTERDERAATREQTEIEQDDSEADDLAAAARALSRKKPMQARETDNGQLSFDFATIPSKEPEQIAATSEMTVSATQDAPVLHTPPTQPEAPMPEVAASIQESPAPELPTVPQAEAKQKRELPVLNSDAYLNLKAQHPDKIIGIHMEGMTVYYGKDAEIAAPALGKKLVTRDIPGLGETLVTGSTLGWQSNLVNLLEKGHSVLFIGEDSAGGYEIIKERTAAEYIPIGMELTIEGRRFQIDSVNFDAGTVSLRDLELTGWFPIFRSESVSFVHSFVEEQQFTLENMQQTLAETAPPEQAPKLVEIDGGEIRSEVVGVYNKGLPFEVVIEKMSFGPERHNFHITDDTLGVGGQKAKYQANIAAIRTLQALETEKRLATPEEQETLSKYVGWGGIADAFDPTRENWSKEYAELKELLTPAEYESARGSVLNAHYTSPTVIKAIYNAVERMDFKPGNILEPAMGVGNFFGLMPESMAASKLYGVELDSLTGRIAKQLYQKADITVAGFETTDRRDFYDLAVGNVPFGEYKVADRAYDKLGFSIHDYFLAKSLDQLRPGGIMAVITSRYTMDKKGTEVRKHLAQKGDLLGAIRLPNNAFKANAGTEVVSDILFFQKRDRAPEREPDWVQTGKTADDLTLNNYFLQHPNMVLGELTSKSTQYGNQELTVAPIPEADLSHQLAEAVQNIAAPNRELLEIDTPAQEQRATAADSKTQRDSLSADPRVRNFSFTLVEGELYFRENSRMKPVEIGVTPAARVRGMVGLRDSARRLIDLQLQGAPDAEIDKEQANLNTLYDKFGKQYGLLNSPANKQAFDQDSAYPLLCSLEIIDEEGKLEKKADMFTKRTIQRPRAVTSVDTASEALAVSIGEKACVDIGYMGALMGGSEKIEGIIKDLQGVIFKDPLSDPDDLHTGWQTADEYLSGNVREKLAIAREATETYPQFAINVERLEQIQPKELSAAEIDVRIGATWISPDYYKQFMFELLHTPNRLQYGKIDIRYSPINGEWNVKGKSEDSRDNTRANVTYGTKRINAYAMIENSLNLRDTRIYDTKYEDGQEKRVLNPKETAIAQQKQEAIGEAFRDWIFKTPERREELCQTYNELYNSTRPREFDGSHINYVGMNPEIHMRPHQSNAVAHMLYGHNTLLAHCVGAGKTFEMIAAAMENKRLGLAQKSLFVVPNHLTEQWGGDFLRLYPGANVLVATKKDFEPANRKKFCARIATGDYDAVIIGHSQFEKIPLSAARQEAIIQDEISEIIDAIQDAKDNDGERYTIKQMEKSKKNLETRLKKLAADEKKDSVVTFEELGVDKLFVDEAHGFKNLFLHTKMRNVAGIGQSEAQKSSDMFGKCRYMDELTAGRGVTFATGTPVSNSMVELYTMMRYLQYDTLQKQGLGHFDSWAANFGEKVTAIELSPEGTGFRSKTRFAKFFNLPELMSMWKESADIQTADMLKLPVPEAEYITVTTEPSEHQQAMVLELADRADEVRKGNVEPNIDNMLKITSDGRKLALDQRLKNELLPDDPDSKVNACVKNVFDVWEESMDIKGAQLLFCDLSTPHYDGTFNVYDDIKNKLIERGIPPEEISFIHDANTENQKAELFAKVRKGQVRVLIGSTKKMGAGTNVQDKLVASHDLDCPWRPADLEQRAGRILRQGNQNSHVKMFKYVTKGTFDAYNWGLVENKQKFIGQIMTSKSPARSAEDIDATALSYAEVKALATGDERIKLKMDLDIQVAKLKLLKSNHTAQKYEMEDKVVKYYPQKIAETKLYIEVLTADMPLLQAHPVRDDAFTMTVMGKLYSERKDAGEAIIAACKTMTDPDQKLDLGEYRGFPMKLSLDGEKFKVSMKQNLTYTAELSSDASGSITRINNAVEAIPDNLVRQKERLVTLQNELASATEEAARPFPKDEELTEKSAKLTQLNIELDMTGKNDAEPEKDSEPDERDTGVKPSILKALKQFEPSTPTNADKGHSYSREAI